MTCNMDHKNRKKDVLTGFLWAVVLTFCFPAFLTFLAVKRKTSPYPRLKWLIVAGSWAFYAFIIYWGIMNHWHW